MEKFWNLMHYVCNAFGGIPLSHHEGTDAYIKWQDNDRYALHSAAVTLLVLAGVRPKRLPEYAPQIRKVAQRCANQLVSPYSHVWAVCRVYGTRPTLPVRTTPQGKRNERQIPSSHCMWLLPLTPIVKSLTKYFFKYSSHALLFYTLRFFEILF